MIQLKISMNRQRSRTKFPLPESLNCRLRLYALAAGAAGVTSLAAAPSADAEVIYTLAHVAIGAGNFYVLDLNHDGISDFRFGNVGRTGVGVFYIEPWGTYGSLNGEQCPTTGPAYPLALRHGAPIGPGKFFYGTDGGPSYNQVLAGDNQGELFGNWINVSNRYVGLRFQINSENHYGWARLTVRLNGTQVSAWLTGYAYETVANRGIRAGQMTDMAGDDGATVRLAIGGGGPTDAWLEQAVPSQSKSLGRLALGGALPFISKIESGEPQRLK
jgi:hypothetical protein